MATSPNYAWAEPDNSSLVKNGAADIRTLGDAIDTSVWNVGFGQAGKNKIINGDFGINQRGFTSTTTTATYIFDRFATNNTGGTVTYSAQTFTLGTAPVAGYEGKNFLDVATTGQSAASDIARVQQQIESVRTFANQPVTISFWAKAASGTPKVALEVQQVFGSGGSPSTAVNTYFGQATLSTAWARYSLTTTLPSISGKTIGTNGDDKLSVNLYTSAGSTYNSRTGSLGIQNATISFWGIQAEYGSKMTPFQTSTGTIQGELAACQRYLPAINSNNYESLGFAYGTTGSQVFLKLPTTARVAPTGITVSNVSHFTLYTSGFSGGNPTTIAINTASIDTASINVTTTAGSPTIATKDPVKLQATNASALILFTGCEL